jgi:M6 family metalloprotease-like protein
VFTEDGIRLDFARDGVWRTKAARVVRARDQLKAQALFDALNAAPRGGAAGASMAGTFRMPTVLLAFGDTPIASLPSAVSYDSVFYTDVPVAGRPYTVHTLYDEMSNGLLAIDGQVFGWQQLADDASYYLDSCGGSNPLDCATGRNRFGDAFRESLAALDGAVDFSLYDNDGGDDTPNSGDDDGVVDVVQFIQPVVGGECGGPGIWAHKFTLTDIGGVTTSGVYTTDDAAAGGGFVTIDSYFVVAGVGGALCPPSGAIMDVGVSAHELGHGLGLPDLYDTGGGSSGIGEWGLMGSGLYTSLASPAHYSAWSKERMGWVTVREITAGETVTVGPVGTADTVLAIRPTGANPRGEYFLLENKQAVGADTANMHTGGDTGPKNGGLLVWHIDSAKVDQSLVSNLVNAGSIHGVALVEADGAGSLRAGSNRGDAGDAFPGTTANTKLSFATVPAAQRNDGGFAGFQVDAVEQVVPNGEMRFRVLFGSPAVVRASSLAATVSVDGVDYTRFEDLMETGRAYEVGIADVQLTADRRSEFTFQSWSDGGARTHSVTDPPAGDSVVAQIATRHRVLATPVGSGSVSALSGVDVEGGVLLAAGASVTLVGEPEPGLVLDRWSGDTTAVGDTLTLHMDHPFDVSATFVPLLAFVDSSLAPGTMGASYSSQVRVTGGAGSGTYGVSLVGGSVPAGISFNLTAEGAELVGVPEETGRFPISVRVTSGNLATTHDFQLEVDAPALAVSRLVDQLLEGSELLTADEVRYLDLLGNRNDGFDVGDFLAWLDAGNGPGAAATVLPDAARREGGGR